MSISSKRCVLLLLADAVLLAKVAFGFKLNLQTRPACSPAAPLARRCTMDSTSFRTEVHIPTWPQHSQLGYADSFFLLGSCFSDNIGTRLSNAKFQTSINPSHGESVLQSGRQAGIERRCHRRRMVAHTTSSPAEGHCYSYRAVHHVHGFGCCRDT